MDTRSGGGGPGSLTVSVRLFARYAEVLGRDTMEVSLPSGSTVADVVAAVRDALPQGHLLPTLPMTAVNLEHVRPERTVRDGDEVALLPPLAGG